MGSAKEVRQVKVRGVKRWQARDFVQGRRLSRLCDSKDAALQAKAELRLQLLTEAEQEAKANATPATLALMCEAYILDLEARGKSPDTIKHARGTWHVLSGFLGHRMQDPITTLTEADIYAFRAHRVRMKIKPATINRDFHDIRAMLRRVLPDFRFPSGVMSEVDDTRVRWLEPLQEIDVMSRLKSPFREIARLAALTLMRQTELLRLRRDQVMLSQGVIQLPKTKTGPGTVVLSAEAQRILQAQLDSHRSEWVFPSRKGQPYSHIWMGEVWRKAARAAGLTDFHFHDLRHHGATMALNAGFTAPIVMALGRWKDEKMMRRYAAVTDKTLRSAAEAVSGNLSQNRGNSGNEEWQQPRNYVPIMETMRPRRGSMLPPGTFVKYFPHSLAYLDLTIQFRGHVAA